MKNFPALPKKAAAVENSPLNDPAHLDMPGSTPPEISLNDFCTP